MGRKVAEILEQARRSQANIRFRDLCRLIEGIGYVFERQRGSHRIYRHPTRRDLPMTNLQSHGRDAKPYQVRQILRLIEDHKLEVKS